MDPTGLVWAAREATRFALQCPEVKHLHIYADNTAAVTSVFEPKSTPGQYNMRTFNKIITDYLARSVENTVHVEWCPGHTDVAGNERADEEAKEGALLWRPRFVTITHAKRRSKERILQKWTEQWRRSPPSGGFGIANRFPPAWKPKEHVISTPREVFGRLTQCRTRHGFIGEYYAKFVSTESIECPCGENFQTRHHIITECERYNSHRHLLTKDFPELSLPDILGTKKGLEALVKFLTKSGAFTKTGEPRRARTRPRLEDEEDEEDGEDEENWWERFERNGEEDEREEGEDEEEEEEEGDEQGT
ncbi:hypothetical protein Hypma_001787 [Hypsizygus marmoreus]|uniref:RNase H type-1 domain-containing protein n=1 Tax=Hypsizygus marmoreus TaxID=39966 RepID=A0A369J836_HYPMA|nr:hypothetical protein Hypma_001787 [Hypsizygus marmoreus]